LAIRIEFIPQTGSTNADLVSRLHAGEHIPDGYWLVADRQSEGKGRQGRTWLDAPGNFMGSTVVNLSPKDEPAPGLSFVAAMALYEVIVRYLAAPQSLRIKWPNDLMLADAKLSGILLERIGEAAVVGIGVNLVAAPALAERQTRYLGQSARAPHRDTFAHELAAAFDVEVERWRTVGVDPLFARLLAASYPLGERLSVHGQDGEAVTGEFMGLEPDGALRLRLADGTTRVIHAGDISLEGD